MFDLYSMLKDLWINARAKFIIAWLNAISLLGALFMAFSFSAVLATSSTNAIIFCSFLILWAFYMLFRNSVNYLQHISHLEKKNRALLIALIEKTH